ncbi:MAG: HD domain-containing protein [Acholeplasmatales bacterium]|nr:HD domain-containing protein [Acholeplasmatales bacterium]
MREPRCTSVVPSKNLWEIAIEFLGKIDIKLMEFNLKYAYITYCICRLEKIPKRIISKLVFLSCFNEVGKHYEGENDSGSQIETYLFLKYFSPIKKFADILLHDEKSKKSGMYAFGYTLDMCKHFTSYLLESNDIDIAYKKLEENKKGYAYLDLFMLNRLIHKTDLLYELNSMHYKTVVYKYISKTIFSSKEKDSFFSMLASLFEMYSAQTLYHSKLTAIIAYMIAKHMKVKSIRCKKIYVAGLCHDLGKVCIPLKILEKPDKLSDREYSIMKRHVEFTKLILKNKMDYDIIEIAYRHHEKMNGTGYPNQLDKISLTIDQRILQVADVISALIAKRSYKEAWSIERTIAILDESANEGNLDKAVVECFKKNQKKILKTTNMLMSQADKVYDIINKEREVLKNSSNN